MNTKALLLLVAALIIYPVQPVEAGDRYSTPPPTTLSPDLSSPWLLQLGDAPNTRKTSAPAIEQRNTFGNHAVKRRKTWKVPTFSGFKPDPNATGIFRVFAKPANNRRSGTTGVNAPKKQPLIRAKKKPQIAYASQPARKPEPARKQLDPKFLPQTITYQTNQPTGTVIVDTNSRFLYLVTGDSTARRYGVGVGKQGFEWSGTHKVTRKAEWPDWRPPAEMIKRERAKGRELPVHMGGGPKNPLGARALYIGDTLYRIHGTNAPWTIGEAVSSGCIRMRNEDVMDLYERVRMGAKVVVS